MKTEIIEHSPTRKELKIEVDAERVRAEMEKAVNNYARLATVPGFRKGHAPPSVVRQRFRTEIQSDVLREVVPQAVTDAITESELKVIGEPEIQLENEESLKDLGKAALRLSAHVEVLPEIALGEYKNLEVTRRVRPVTDETVGEVIENLREASATLAPVEDRGATEGDTVTVDFEGKYLNPPEDEPIQVEDVDVVLGGEGVLADFNEHLMGVQPDDERTFTIKYPEDFSSKGLAGKEIEYTARVKAVGREEMPELNDEWAHSVSDEVETLDALRERVRGNLTDRARDESDHRLRVDVMRKLIAAHQFEVPETMIEYQSQRLMQSAMRAMIGSGLDPRDREINWDVLREAVAPQAVDDLRGSMLLERIADEEQIDVSDEEINNEIEALAEAIEQTPDAVRDALTKQGGDRSIADRLRNRKALDLLVENARVTDEEWRDDEEEPDEDEEQAATADAPDDNQTSAVTANDDTLKGESAAAKSE